MNKDQDIENLNADENTMYFGEDRTYERNDDQSYSKEEVEPVNRPLNNKNSVEYDDGDYESMNYDETENDSRKKVIIAYIFTLIVIVLIILIAFIKL